MSRSSVAVSPGCLPRLPPDGRGYGPSCSTALAALGGNLGPAMIVGGSVAGEAPVTLPGGLQGIPKEVNDEMEALRSETGHKYADIPNIISHLAAQKALAAGVEILVPVWVGDPIIEGAVRHRAIRRG